MAFLVQDNINILYNLRRVLRNVTYKYDKSYLNFEQFENDTSCTFCKNETIHISSNLINDPTYMANLWF